MAEVLGTTLGLIGAVGVLGQIFDGCIKAYAIFTAANNLGRDSERLVCKIRIEEMRLAVWGREWGIVEGKLEAHLRAESKAGNERMAILAKQILSELYNTITDFKKLQEKYGIQEDLASPIGEKAAAQKKADPASVTSQLRNGLRLKARWVIADKEKFTILLKDLKDYNDGLEQLFPPSRLATVQRAWTIQLLQSTGDLGELGLLENASNGVYPQLNASARLKQLRINLDSKPVAKFKPTVALKIPRGNLSISEIDSGRSQGTYQNPSSTSPEDVLIEWAEYDREDFDARFHQTRRVDDLARILHSAADRHPDLHTINCVGYTDDSASSRYGIVYRAPQASCSTLNALISSNDLRTPDLSDRFKLAHTLAVALWSLHSLDWLHKSFASSNILFFPSAFSTAATRDTSLAASVPDISSPYLLGFDTSRPDHMGEMSVAPKTCSATELHRHPNSLNGMSRKPYCRSYDIYSLGLVLLEIGLWKALQTYHKPHYSAQRFLERVVIQNLVPNLGSKTGRIYKDVVQRCLAAPEDLSVQQAGELLEDVVSSLEGLRV
jgi:serine/threonine protein kinase